MKNSVGLFKIFIRQSHPAEHLIVENVDAAASIHEYLSKLVSTNLRCHYPSQVTQIINPGQVILSAPHNRLLGPMQITWNRWLNGIDGPLVKFLVVVKT